jgi:hypothetical protein
LASELLDLFWAAGLRDDGSSERGLWLQLSKESIQHADLANGFTRVSRASNPLSSEVCSGDIAKGLERKLAAHWARKASTGQKKSIKLAHLDWEQLTRQEQFEIRRMAGDLALYHQGFVTRHRPRKNGLDTLLWELADLFARHSGWRHSVLLLPSAERSLFIQFSHRALKSLSGRDAPFAISEVSVQALSRRWHRLVEHARIDPGPVKRKPRRTVNLRRSRSKSE